MKSAQAASEIKQVYINKYNRKLKSMEKNTVNSPKRKPSKPWWTHPYSVEWKKFTQLLKMPQKVQQREKFLNKQIMSPTFSLINDQNKNEDLSPDMEIIKITTVVEAIRQKRQKSAQMLEAAKNIQKIIGKKRSKRSSYESGNNSTVNKDLWHARQGKSIVSSKKSRYPKPDYRKQPTRTLPTKKRLRNKNVADLKTASNVAIPSTVFYKRIWEYINGTRPHSDIINGYNSLENNSKKNNSTCTDKERITGSQSQEDKSQATSPNIEPERDFYKRIWDIINATQSNGNTKARSKRNASILKSNAASNPLCVQEGTVSYEEEVQATNEETSLGISDTINSPGPYISGFWTIANETEWQPKRIPVVNIAKLNKDPLLSSLVNSASEVDDLNKFPDKVDNVNYSSSDNSTTGYANEARNSSQEIITEPGPPYSSEESFATSSFSPTENTIGNASQEKDETEHGENYSTDTTPDYDPLNIPYVDVPDYSDQQEDSLDKSNQSAAAARYKEYVDSDYDYSPKSLYDADDFSSKSPSAEIKVVQTESDEPDTSLNANNSRSGCTESKDSAECVDKYDVEDTKLRNNTENVTDDDVHRSVEDSAESELSEENENSDFDFDINEYKKPFNWDEFFKNDPIMKSIRSSFNKYYYKENPDETEESEEAEKYATNPKEQSHYYFAKNEDSHDDHRIASSDDRDETNDRKEETDSYAKKEAKDSETIDYYPYDDKDFFKHIFGKDKDDKKSEYNHKENPDRTEESEEVETYVTDPKEHEENSDRAKKFEKVDSYATNPKEQSQDYFAKNEDYHNNHRIVSDDRDEKNDREEEPDSYAKQKVKESEAIDEDSYPYNDRDEADDREDETNSYAKQEAKESEVIDEDPHSYEDENFFKHIFGNNDKESSDTVDREKEFLSRYFTKDVLHQLRDNSTTEEDKQREESKNKEDVRKTLSRILNKKDRFSRLDENLNKMIEKGDTIPIKYNNFWSLEYKSPRKRYEDNEEKAEDSKEEA